MALPPPVDLVTERPAIGVYAPPPKGQSKVHHLRMPGAPRRGNPGKLADERYRELQMEAEAMLRQDPTLKKLDALSYEIKIKLLTQDERDSGIKDSTIKAKVARPACAAVYGRQSFKD